jgi:hypothetical protein
VDDFFPNIVQHSYDTGYVGESYEYQLFLTDTSGISSFEWIYGYGPPSLQFDDGLLYGVPNSSGVFPCLIMIKNNDIDLITDHIESNIVILDPAFFPERSETKKLGITPNPFFSDFTVSISSMNNEKFLMECSDLTGKVIHSLVLQSENTRINGDEMYRGLYIITIKSINGKIIEAIKLIKK